MFRSIGIIGAKLEEKSDFAKLVKLETKYNPHIEVSGKMRPTPRDATQFTYNMWDIPNPDFIDLMNLFIS